MRRDMTPEQERFLAACVDMIGRTGARDFQIRFSEETPVAWTAVASYGKRKFECAAAPAPHDAVYRLVERLCDGGMCAHCGKPTGVDDNWQNPMTESVAGEWACWLIYDPELGTFRQQCQEAT